MEIKDFFSEDKTVQSHWITEIQKSDWSAAGFLVELLTKWTFHETLGEGGLYLLTDGAKLMSALPTTLFSRG